jgi:hypothetical protein
MDQVFDREDHGPQEKVEHLQQGPENDIVDPTLLSRENLIHVVGHVGE